MELCGGDRNLNLKIEVFDDDGKKGPDKRDDLIGVGFFSVKQLEAANTVQAPLQVGVLLLVLLRLKIELFLILRLFPADKWQDQQKPWPASGAVLQAPQVGGSIWRRSWRSRRAH